MKELFEKYIKRECSKEEVDQIVNYLKNSTNLDSVPTFEDISKLLKGYADMDKTTANRIYNGIIEELEERSAHKHIKKRPYFWRYAAAAIILGICSTAYYFNFHSTDSFEGTPAIVEEQITLQLENGNIEIISEIGSSQIYDKEGNVVGVQNGNQLVYGDEVEKEELTYNTLNIPYGKQFKIQLSDGTTVHLNAGSSLRYPVTFIHGENRQVFLDGEAFFKVSKDSDNPFIVNAENLNIRVLGTEFNVSSYPEDNHINTVLVEGSVSLYEDENDYTPNSSLVLKPGYKGAWDKAENKISVEEADVEMHTAWLNGRIILKHMSFDQIVRKLERHYNVVIDNQNKALGKELITASFDIETIDQVLDIINEMHPIEYTINNDTINIK